jgi:putative addiction module component (TIGR02574 family)
MSQIYQQILEQAKTLSRQERFALVQAILAQIEGEVATAPEAAASSEETDALLHTLERRMADLRTGRMQAVPGEAVMAKLRKRLG